jgi:transketolase
MKLKDGFDMTGKDEDIFFLSNGHISPVWYATLARKGYFPVDELATFRKIDSRLQGHPATEEGLPGIRVASGSLGQGLSVALGAAQSKKLSGDPSHVYVLMGDGEQQEGQVWEAAMYAAHHQVDNIIAAIDCNNQQIDGTVRDVMNLIDLSAKWKAFGWEIVECNGNDMQDVVHKLDYAKTLTGKGKPVVIMLQTVMGSGVDYMEGTHKWHGVAPNDGELDKALNQLPETLGDY